LRGWGVRSLRFAPVRVNKNETPGVKV
jgi:hypothetical protein